MCIHVEVAVFSFLICVTQLLHIYIVAHANTPAIAHAHIASCILWLSKSTSEREHVCMCLCLCLCACMGVCVQVCLYVHACVYFQGTSEQLLVRLTK